MHCYLNGKIIPENEAKISIFDIGLLRGFGIYEAMTAIGISIFMADDHLARFRNSAQFLNITIPKSDEQIKKIIGELIEKNGFAEKGKRSNIKFILTGGTAIGGIDFNPATPTFYIFLEEWKPLPADYYTNGAKLLSKEFLRENPGYKTTNYISAVMLQKQMQSADALETLYSWQGKVLECATSNIFIVTDGIVVTPKENILKGITRNVTLHLLLENNIPHEERDISETEFYSAQECFLTSSFKDVVPIISVADRVVGHGQVGLMTLRIMDLFEKNLAKI